MRRTRSRNNKRITGHQKNLNKKATAIVGERGKTDEAEPKPGAANPQAVNLSRLQSPGTDKKDYKRRDGKKNGKVKGNSAASLRPEVN